MEGMEVVSREEEEMLARKMEELEAHEWVCTKVRFLLDLHMLT